jgi:hypothetical protein
MNEVVQTRARLEAMVFVTLQRDTCLRHSILRNEIIGELCSPKAAVNTKHSL